MKHKLPPLNALKAFESAAKNLSFTNAASELCITQGAISKQVKILEEFLGVFLFQRIGQGLILTAKGKEYYQNIYPALNSIRASTNLIRGNSSEDNILTINVLPSLSSYWLIPRIHSFKKNYPDIQLSIISGDGEIDFSKTKSDIGIRSGYQEYSGLENIKFFDEEMLMVANSGLTEKIKTIHDIQKFNILEHSCRPNVLKEWINLVGLTIYSQQKRIGFEHFFMIIEAAKQGLGIGFVPRFLLDDLLKKRELVNLLNLNYKTNYHYYLLFQKENKNNPKIKIFCDWVNSLS
jgi:LysR family glycine cleavage system transcriptional activator